MKFENLSGKINECSVKVGSALPIYLYTDEVEQDCSQTTKGFMVRDS